MNIPIPRQYLQTFVELSRLDQSQWDRLVDVLKETPPGFSYSTTVSKLIAKSIDLFTPEAGVTLVHVISGLYLNFYRSPADLDQFSESLRANLEQRIKDVSAETLDLLCAGLRRVLELEDTFGVYTKGLNLHYSEQKLFSDCQIVSDIRPVFGPDPGDEPGAAMIVHALRLQYFESPEEREVYISLDAEDLLALKKAAERALNKEDTLRSFLKRVGWHDMGEST